MNVIVSWSPKLHLELFLCQMTFVGVDSNIPKEPVETEKY